MLSSCLIVVVRQGPGGSLVQIQVDQTHLSIVDQVPRVGRVPSRRIGETIVGQVFEGAGGHVHHPQSPEGMGQQRVAVLDLDLAIVNLYHCPEVVAIPIRQQGFRGQLLAASVFRLQPPTLLHVDDHPGAVGRPDRRFGLGSWLDW